MSATNAATRQHAITRIEEFYDRKRQELLDALPEVPPLQSAGQFYGEVEDDLKDAVVKAGYVIGKGSYHRDIYRKAEQDARDKVKRQREAALTKAQPKLDKIERDRASAIDRVYFWGRDELFEFLEGLE